MGGLDGVASILSGALWPKASDLLKIGGIALCESFLVGRLDPTPVDVIVKFHIAVSLRTFGINSNPIGEAGVIPAAVWFVAGKFPACERVSAHVELRG